MRRLGSDNTRPFFSLVFSSFLFSLVFSSSVFGGSLWTDLVFGVLFPIAFLRRLCRPRHRLVHRQRTCWWLCRRQPPYTTHLAAITRVGHIHERPPCTLPTFRALGHLSATPARTRTAQQLSRTRIEPVVDPTAVRMHRRLRCLEVVVFGTVIPATQWERVSGAVGLGLGVKTTYSNAAFGAMTPTTIQVLLRIDERRAAREPEGMDEKKRASTEFGAPTANPSRKLRRGASGRRLCRLE